MYKIKIAASKAITPPSLFGIDRRIAYSHRKYHSGWMCLGVIIGFASEKFSGSISMLGERRMTIMKILVKIKNPRTSFIVKYRWNGIRSEFELIPRGLFDPLL